MLKIQLFAMLPTVQPNVITAFWQVLRKELIITLDTSEDLYKLHNAINVAQYTWTWTWYRWVITTIIIILTNKRKEAQKWSLYKSSDVAKVITILPECCSNVDKCHCCWCLMFLQVARHFTLSPVWHGHWNSQLTRRTRRLEDIFTWQDISVKWWRRVHRSHTQSPRLSSQKSSLIMTSYRRLTSMYMSLRSV